MTLHITCFSFWRNTLMLCFYRIKDKSSGKSVHSLHDKTPFQSINQFSLAVSVQPWLRALGLSKYLRYCYSTSAHTIIDMVQQCHSVVHAEYYNSVILVGFCPLCHLLVKLCYCNGEFSQQTDLRGVSQRTKLTLLQITVYADFSTVNIIIMIAEGCVG